MSKKGKKMSNHPPCPKPRRFKELADSEYNRLMFHAREYRERAEEFLQLAMMYEEAARTFDYDGTHARVRQRLANAMQSDDTLGDLIQAAKDAADKVVETMEVPEEMPSEKLADGVVRRRKSDEAH